MRFGYSEAKRRPNSSTQKLDHLPNPTRVELGDFLGQITPFLSYDGCLNACQCQEWPCSRYEVCDDNSWWSGDLSAAEKPKLHSNAPPRSQGLHIPTTVILWNIPHYYIQCAMLATLMAIDDIQFHLDLEIQCHRFDL